MTTFASIESVGLNLPDYGLTVPRMARNAQFNQAELATLAHASPLGNASSGLSPGIGHRLTAASRGADSIRLGRIDWLPEQDSNLRPTD